jgi:hypothetical protein
MTTQDFDEEGYERELKRYADALEEARKETEQLRAAVRSNPYSIDDMVCAVIDNAKWARECADKAHAWTAHNNGAECAANAARAYEHAAAASLSAVRALAVAEGQRTCGSFSLPKWDDAPEAAQVMRKMREAGEI